MRKKITFLTNSPAPYTRSFFEQLQKEFDVYVLYERKQASNREKKWVKKSNISYNEIYLHGIPYAKELAFCPFVFKYLHNADLIIVGDYSSFTGLFSILYMHYKHIPFVLHIDGGIINTNEKRFKFLFKKFFISKASAYMSSGKMTDLYIRHYGNLKVPVYHYPYTSVPYDEILKHIYTKEKKNSLRKYLKLDYNCLDSFLVVSVGSIIFRKGFDILIKAAKKCPRCIYFLIIGGTPYKELSNLIKDLNINNIFFIPFCEPEKVKFYLRSADLYVFPTRYDIWGLVINEAMAAGLPVITTDKCVAGIELVENGKNGFVVPADDSIELANAINKYYSLSNNEKRNFAENSLSKIKPYSLENMTYEYACSLTDFINKQIREKK